MTNSILHIDEIEPEDLEWEYYYILDALVCSILELKDIIVDIRKEVDLWNPSMPYRYDLYSDISHCFDDYFIAKLYPDIFNKLL